MDFYQRAKRYSIEKFTTRENRITDAWHQFPAHLKNREKNHIFSPYPLPFVGECAMLIKRNRKFCFQAATKTFDFVVFLGTKRLEIRKGDGRNGSRNGEMV
jgi:hypothetical protein